MSRTQGTLLALLALLALSLVGATLFMDDRHAAPVATQPEPIQPAAAPAAVPAISEQVIGSSVEGRPITATTYGTGDTHLLFVGGVHGGYEWNSVLLAYAMMDHLEATLSTIPANVRVSIIPDLNPDGTFVVTGKSGRFTAADVPNPDTRVADGRFNANGVDLNRNFDCKWAPTSTWRGEVVSAGTEPFSEPEAAALRDYVLETTPDAVIFWHSQANTVYASECENGILPETLALMETYAVPASYGQVPAFDAYPITGDAEGWLASIGIPAITVELEGYRSIEWERNLAGTEAVLQRYAQ